MIDPDRPPESQSNGSARRSPQRVRPVVFIAPVVFALTATAGLVLIRTHTEHVQVQWIVLAMLACAAALLLAGVLLHHVLHWRRPIERIQAVIDQVREGEGADLPEVDGPLSELMERLGDLLNVLKQQRAQLAQADFEMRQKLAKRTDALQRVISSLRLQANRDPLTGLYNRRMFDQHVPGVIDQSRASGADLCLIMLDLDHFKLLNDTLGHAAGDQFLRSVGQLIRSTVRENDLAFRCGGDEFVIVLPESGRDAGNSLGQRLVSLIDALGKTHKLARPLGVSAGLATLRETGATTLSALIKEADTRLYSTKQSRKMGAQAA